MIVKNEVDWIEGALDSVKNLVDEVIIVDTGCSDATLAKIQHFSPKIIAFNWIDDFAAARNVSLEAATQPWILVLDADERIAARDIAVLQSATRRNEDGFHLIQRNYVSSNNIIGWTPNAHEYEEGHSYLGYVDNPLIRFFRNSPEIRFRYAVHEIIDPTRMGSNYRFGHLPVPIHHYGKVLDGERVAQKQRLYFAIGQKKVEREPKNWKAHFELGIQCQELQRHIEACRHFERAWSLSKYPNVLLFWAVSEKHRGQLNQAADLIERASSLGFKSFELHLELGNVYQALGNLQKAKAEYTQSLKLQPGSSAAAFNCGLVQRKLGNQAEAERMYRLALKLEPSFQEPALDLASLFMDGGRFDEAHDLLMSVYRKKPECREVRLGLAKYHVQTSNPDEALAILDEVEEQDAVGNCLVGAAYLLQNELDLALQHLERALKRDRKLVDARINLAEVYARKGDHARAARYMVAAREQIAVMK